MEDITLLWVLNEVPETPLKNNPPSILNSRRQLSVEREKEITENLAFLSATTEDSKRVTAVCIEEHTQEAGLTIRVASNAGNISEIEEGLKRIAKILEEAAARGLYTRLLLLNPLLKSMSSIFESRRFQPTSQASRHC